MEFKRIIEQIGKWGGLLRFFPSDPDARIGIAEAIAEMTQDEEHVRWLVRRVSQLHAEWPGILEVRAVFCSKFKPDDGIDVGSAMPQFRDGIPSERTSEPVALPSGNLKRLEAGEVSAAPSLRETVADLKRVTDLRRNLTPIIRPVATTRPAAITPEMWAAAEAEYRAKKLAEYGERNQ